MNKFKVAIGKRLVIGRSKTELPNYTGEKSKDINFLKLIIRNLGAAKNLIFTSCYIPPEV